MSATNTTVPGYCLPISVQMINYYRGQYASEKRRGNYGLLKAVVSQPNRADVELPSFDGGMQGKKREISFRYMQRAPFVAPDDSEGEICSGGEKTVWKEKTINPTYKVWDKLRVDFSDLQRFCDGEESLIRRQIDTKLHNLAMKIDAYLISFLIANPGKMKGGGTFGTYNLYDETNERVKYSEWTRMLADIQDLGTGNQVMIVGEAEMRTVSRAARIGTMQTNTGIDMARIDEDVMYERDDLTNSYLTPNNRCIIGLNPGAYQMLPWNRNPPIPIEEDGTEYGQLYDPLTGINYDIFIRKDGCDKDRRRTILLEKWFEPFLLQQDSYDPTDELFEVNGTALITTTP